MGDKKKLTALQERFCTEFLVDFNATRAAIRAGYSKNGAGQQGSALLKIIKVQKRIKVEALKLVDKTDLTAQKVIDELQRVAFSTMDDYAEWGPDGVTLLPSGEMEPDAARCVSEVSQTQTKDGGSIRFKLHDKVQALDKLGRYFKLFTEKHEHTGADGAPLPDVIRIFVVPTKGGEPDDDDA